MLHGGGEAQQVCRLSLRARDAPRLFVHARVPLCVKREVTVESRVSWGGVQLFAYRLDSD